MFDLIKTILHDKCIDLNTNTYFYNKIFQFYNYKLTFFLDIFKLVGAIQAKYPCPKNYMVTTQYKRHSSLLMAH